MSKTVTFTNKDEELIKRITKFQHVKEIPSFTEAVRVLCREALDAKKQ